VAGRPTSIIGAGRGRAVTFSVDGAWMRQSVSIDGSEHFELQRAYWLQAGDIYADLRVPFHPSGGTSCFCGRSGWVGERYSWTHGLDLAGPGADEVGDLFWDGDRLIERGVLGDLAYEEVWVRLPDSGGDSDGDRGGESDVLDEPGVCRVRVGGHAMAIVDERSTGGTFSACYWVRRTERWEVSAAIGDGGALHAPRLRPAMTP
jgi:hypothetical protein